jgi:P pilus assembly chaperone PapD
MRLIRFPALLALAALALAAPASAELIISQLVIKLTPDSRTADIEVFNSSEERSYVVVEPREMIAPGTSAEKPFVSPDPEVLGLLVSPRRMIFEPGQRRSVRIARLGAAGPTERVYRVTVKPVAGDLSGSESGLKLLVGYDLLVISRPSVSTTDVRVERTGQHVTLTNRGSSSVELADGKQCDTGGRNCEALPGKRLYAGASWRLPLQKSGKGSYRVRSDEGWKEIEF